MSRLAEQRRLRRRLWRAIRRSGLFRLRLPTLKSMSAGYGLSPSPARYGRDALPAVTTMSEAGFPDIAGDSWVGVLAPAGTSKDIVDLLHREIVAIITEPDTKARLKALGYEPVASTPDEFGDLIGAQLQLWSDVVRRANIKSQ